jgi:hypothetical protein
MFNARGRTLFGDHSSGRSARRLFCRRDHECDPGIPAVGPVLVGEFPVAFDIEITLRLGGQGNDESELRPGAHHLRLEAAHAIAGAAVAPEFCVHVADDAGLELLSQELGRGPIEMHVDAVLILRRLIGEIVGEAEHAREFVAGLRIEIGVARAGRPSLTPLPDLGRSAGQAPLHRLQASARAQAARRCGRSCT